MLVSEVMLQQTQAPRVERHWIAFMARFPTPVELAAASVGDVLRAWQGLGYNRRAVRLRGAAVAIVERHAGRVPGDLEQLAALPGIGPYTARAVAAIAFGLSVAPLDTNIRRILGRALHGHSRAGDPCERPAAGRLQAEADDHLAGSDPRAWTLAAMDLGATICRPRAPRCPDCPLQGICRFAALVSVERPSPARSRPSPRFETTTRWLRGRLVDALRAAPPGTWTVIAGPLGDHPPDAVAAAILRLHRDGLVEVDQEGRARLPG